MFKICTEAGEAMISYEAIVQQIEKHVAQAKQQQSEAALREQLTAIHTLCEIVLQTGEKQALTASPNVQTRAAIVTSTKLEESDANGESLFDF